MDKIISLELIQSDKLLPCPFCGENDLELCNTHTPSYWIECLTCRASVHGEYFSPRKKYIHEGDLTAHKKSKYSAIKKWNRRNFK